MRGDFPNDGGDGYDSIGGSAGTGTSTRSTINPDIAADDVVLESLERHRP
jgi:hypothetical protein